jgi:hypothetical protein
MTTRKRITRAEAQRLGLKRYYTGKPCGNKHVAERRTVGGKCIECHKRNANKYRAAHAEAYNARSFAWAKEHPDRQAARFGLAAARRRSPHCVPEDFDFEATIPFYAAAREFSRIARERFEVDHIVALCDGGQHVASNLQVISRLENRRKAVAELNAARAR